MRTNIVIDDDLLIEARKLTGLATKRAVIEEALRFLVTAKRQERVLTLRGKIRWEDDLDLMRRERVFDGDSD